MTYLKEMTSKSKLNVLVSTQWYLYKIPNIRIYKLPGNNSQEDFNTTTSDITISIIYFVTIDFFLSLFNQPGWWKVKYRLIFFSNNLSDEIISGNIYLTLYSERFCQFASINNLSV